MLVHEHLQSLFSEPALPTNSEAIHELQSQVTQPVQRRLIDKYDGKRLALSTSLDYGYKRITDRLVSPTDSDAAPMRSTANSDAKLGYHTHYVVDGGKARIILAALITPASVMDNTPILDLVRWVRFRWQIHPRIDVGDTRYGTTYNIVGFEQDGIAAYLPTPDFGKRTKYYAPDMFQYDATRNLYRCPAGQELPLFTKSTTVHGLIYRGDATTCNACPLKPKCTNSRSGKHLFRSIYQDYLEQVQHYQVTEAYKKALRKRQVWVEPLFGEGKQWHGMARFRLRGLLKVNIEGLLRAAGQNIKRLLKAKPRVKPFQPVPAGASPLIPAFPLGSTFF